MGKKKDTRKLFRGELGDSMDRFHQSISTVEEKKAHQ
jgi:hypothetical protein